MGVPLDAGSKEQKIVFHLANTEAVCRTPAVLTLRSDAVLPAPEAEFLEPRQDKAVSDARASIRFQVKSKTRLERVRLLRQGHPPVSIDLTKGAGVGDTYELSATAEIELASGPNHLSVEAISLGGRLPDSPQLVLNYVPPPLRIEIERMTELRADGSSIANSQKRGMLVFPEVGFGRVWLHGYISWADKGAKRRDDSFLLRVCQWVPASALPRGAQADEIRTPFEVRLILNRRSGNRISLIASRQDAGNSSEVWVDCVKPISGQRLHILALAPHSHPDEVKQQLQKAIQARQKESVDGRESSFTDVRVLPPLTGTALPRRATSAIGWAASRKRFVFPRTVPAATKQR